MKKKTNSKFIEEIGKIKNPVIFLGIARLLGVSLYESVDAGDPKDASAREFCDVCADVIKSFDGLSRSSKREILSLLQKANKEELKNANRTKNSEESVSNEEM